MSSPGCFISFIFWPQAMRIAFAKLRLRLFVGNKEYCKPLIQKQIKAKVLAKIISKLQFKVNCNNIS